MLEEVTMFHDITALDTLPAACETLRRRFASLHSTRTRR